MVAIYWKMQLLILKKELKWISPHMFPMSPVYTEQNRCWCHWIFDHLDNTWRIGIWSSKRKKSTEKAPSRADYSWCSQQGNWTVLQEGLSEVMYHWQIEVTVNDVSLADSTGKEIAVQNFSHWRHWNYYSQNGFVPNRRKLYTMVDVSNKVKFTSRNRASFASFHVIFIQKLNFNLVL